MASSWPARTTATRPTVPWTSSRAIYQAMVLDTAAEWTTVNETASPAIAHPFHIHINPFPVTEVFDPNDPAYQFSDRNAPCYVDPSDPATWRPCPATQLSAPYQ